MEASTDAGTGASARASAGVRTGASTTEAIAGEAGRATWS